MASKTYYAVQFDYNLWANQEIAEALKRQESAISNRQKAILGHILGAEQLWLDRLQASSSGIMVWPEVTINGFLESVRRLNLAYLSLLDEIDAEEFSRPVAYVNSEGIPWANRVEEILIHVLLHSSYHRGQLALLIRDEGGTPVLTDFIHAVRTGLIDDIG
ncbi:MAG: hypothetical protein HKN43_17405 [Rhodothermales bacterium]|nr:hypothetical protein [Rhodothermales bacterium]